MYRCSCKVVPLGVGWYYTVIKKIVIVYIVFHPRGKLVGFGDITSLYHTVYVEKTCSE